MAPAHTPLCTFDRRAANRSAPPVTAQTISGGGGCSVGGEAEFLG